MTKKCKNLLKIARKAQERSTRIALVCGQEAIMADTTSVPTPGTSTTEPTIDQNAGASSSSSSSSDSSKPLAKPISGPAAGAKKDKSKGKDKKDKVEDDDNKPEQRRRPGMIITEPVKGTRDFAPDDMRVRNWLFGHWRYVEPIALFLHYFQGPVVVLIGYRETARLFGFQEFDAPILEHEELYVRKAGEEITQQV